MSPSLRKTIGWWQLCCGLLGLGMLGAMRLDLPHGSLEMLEKQLRWPSYLMGCGFFSLATTAGFRLLRGVPGAVKLAFWCQAPQVISFAFLHGPKFVASAGPSVSLTVNSHMIWVGAGFNAEFFIGTLVSGHSFEVVVNILALVWAVILFRAWRSEAQTSSIITAPEEGTHG